MKFFFTPQTYKHLAGRLRANGIQILTIEAVSDTDQMDKHVDNLIVRIRYIDIWYSIDHFYCLILSQPLLILRDACLNPN